MVVIMRDGMREVRCVPLVQKHNAPVCSPDVANETEAALNQACFA